MLEETLFYIFIIGMMLWEFYLIDRLLEYEHRKFHSEWIADGKPAGIFWRPKDDQSTIGRSEFGAWCVGRMFYSTPNWVKQDKYARLLLRSIRIVLAALVLLVIYIKTF